MTSCRGEMVRPLGENVVVRRCGGTRGERPNGFCVRLRPHGRQARRARRRRGPHGRREVEPRLQGVRRELRHADRGDELVVRKEEVLPAAIDKQKEIYVGQLKEELDSANARIAELKTEGHGLSEADLKAEMKHAESRKGPPEAMWPKVVDGKI